MLQFFDKRVTGIDTLGVDSGSSKLSFPGTAGLVVEVYPPVNLANLAEGKIEANSY